jgi:hypothetical protein
MLRLARECGITAAESRIETIGGKDVLLIKLSAGTQPSKVTHHWLGHRIAVPMLDDIESLLYRERGLEIGCFLPTPPRNKARRRSACGSR